MLINKPVDDRNITGIAQVSIHDLCNSCDVVIIDMLVDRHCFIHLHLICYGSPPEVRYLWYPCGSLGGFCKNCIYYTSNTCRVGEWSFFPLVFCTKFPALRITSSFYWFAENYYWTKKTRSLLSCYAIAFSILLVSKMQIDFFYSLVGTGLCYSVLDDNRKISNEYQEEALPFIQKHGNLGFDAKVHTLELYRHMVGIFFFN